VSKLVCVLLLLALAIGISANWLWESAADQSELEAVHGMATNLENLEKSGNLKAGQGK